MKQKEKKEWKPGTRIKMKIYGCGGSYKDNKGPFICRYNFAGKEDDSTKVSESELINNMLRRIKDRLPNFDKIYIHRVVSKTNHLLIATLDADGRYIDK